MMCSRIADVLAGTGGHFEIPKSFVRKTTLEKNRDSIEKH